jgi:hypothetical protein
MVVPASIRTGCRTSFPLDFQPDILGTSSLCLQGADADKWLADPKCGNVVLLIERGAFRQGITTHVLRGPVMKNLRYGG